MSDEPAFEPVVNDLPPVVAVLAVAILLVELILWAASSGLVGGGAGFSWRRDLMLQFGFPGTMLDYFGQAGFLTIETQRFVTYPFVHYGFVHAVMVMVFLLALGKMVGDVYGNVAVAITFFGSAVVGALVYGLTGDPRPLLGGYPAVYGLIGAFTFLLWVRLGQTGDNQYRAFSLIAFLLGIQLVFGLLFGSGLDWIAEIAGFATGFAIAPIVAPGGFKRLRERMRQR